MTETQQVNLSTGNQRLCPVCKGSKMATFTSNFANTTMRVGGCAYCNNTGFAQPINNLDAEGLPKNVT